MPWFDLPLDQLRQDRTETAEPETLTRWWDERLGEAHAAARPARIRSRAGLTLSRSGPHGRQGGVQPGEGAVAAEQFHRLEQRR
jgi:hypothetical protein